MQKLTNLNQAQVDKALIEVYGPRFKEYREKWYRVETSRGTYLPEYPLHLDLEINGKCNLRCAMCSRSIYGKAMINQGLSREEIVKILEESQGKSYSLLLGNNDEPLVDKEKCLWVLEEATRRGFIDIFLGTNGVLLDEEVISGIIALKVSRLTVSIDAAKPATYQAIRGKDAYASVIKNLELFLKLRARHASVVPMLRVSFVEMEANRAEKQEFLEYWDGKADNILIQECIDLTRTPEELSERQRQELFASKDICLQPFRRLAVSGDGEIYPCCCFISDKKSLGNIKTVSLAQAWNSPYIKSMRAKLIDKNFKDIPFCARCVVATAKRQKND